MSRPPCYPWPGQPPLTEAQWVAFRDWQHREIKRYTYSPAALARRKRVETELAAGRVFAFGDNVPRQGILMGSIPLLSPEPPIDLEGPPLDLAA